MRNTILALLCCSFLLGACNVADDFKASNITDMVTVVDQVTLMNDYGAVYTITENMIKGSLNKGDRLLIYFDVLNSNYDIVLKSYTVSVIVVPQPASEEPAPDMDPVTITGSSISGGYVNVQFTYYRNKRADTQHTFTVEYKEENNQLHLTLIHDGNGENPSLMDARDLEEVSALYSFKMFGLVPSGESRYIFLTLDELKEEGGQQVVRKHTYQLYDQPLSF